MKRDKRRRKNGPKVGKGIIASQKETFFEHKKIQGLNSAKSYYVYNLACEAIKHKKTVFAEINGSENSIVDVFYKALKDNGGSDIIFYFIDKAFADEHKKQNFLETIEKQEITESQIRIFLLSDTDAVTYVDEKTIDVVFLDENIESLYEDLYIWYPKLKDDGWFSGHISFFKEFELGKFVAENDLGYAIISMPHSKDIFEIYSEYASSGLRRIKEFLNMEMFGDAKDTAKLLMLQYPHSPFVANLKAELDYQSGLMKEARSLFKKIVDTWPYHVRALNNLAAVEANLGNLNHAKAIFKKILEIDPFNFDAKHNLDQLENVNMK